MANPSRGGDAKPTGLGVAPQGGRVAEAASLRPLAVRGPNPEARMRQQGRWKVSGGGSVGPMLLFLVLVALLASVALAAVFSPAAGAFSPASRPRG